MIPVFALAVTAVLHNPFTQLSTRSTPSIGRVDQASRQIPLRDLEPGRRYDVYVNGRVIASGTARSSMEMLPLRSLLHPGTIISVVAPAVRGRAAMQTSTQVQNDYLQYHYDVAHTGWNPYETTLTTANVNSTTFGHLFSLPVDGFVWAEPLYVAAANVAGGTHDTAVVVTENDSVYTFDADSGAQLWHRNYANPAAGANPIPYQVVKAQDIAPTIGITSTPVIDPNTNIVYFVAAIQQTNPNQTFTYHQFLHAVNLADGSDIAGSPVDITATAILNNGKAAVFDPLHQLNRASLLLANGLVYVGFGSHNDEPGGKPHGWIMAYDPASLQLRYFINTTTDVTTRYYACIWGAGWGPVADEFGDVYVATGDGVFDGDTGGHNWGDTVLRMTSGLAIKDTFTPEDQAQLLLNDHDLGGGGVIILPDQAGAYPHLALAAGLEGTIYLLDRDHLGGYTPGGPDNVLQELTTALGTLRGGPAYYGGPTGQFLYYCGNGNQLSQWQLNTSPSPHLTLFTTSAQRCGTGGTIPMVSSNGTVSKTGIVWMTNRPGDKATQPVQLFAFDATNVRHKLFGSSVAFWTNLHSQPFLTPAVVNGKVFVGTPSSVEVFGLLSSRAGLHRTSLHEPR